MLATWRRIESTEILRRHRPTTEDLERWEAARRCWRWSDDASRRPGKPSGCARGRKEAHLYVGRCMKCGALVDWEAARSEAKRAGRDYFKEGDGCSSRVCSSSHRPGGHAKGQAAMARVLESGARRLVAWPLSVDSEEWEAAGPKVTRRAARAARANARVPDVRKPGRKRTI